jgi:hypothetical protein
MSMTSIKKIERNRSTIADLDHVSVPLARDLPGSEAACCFVLGGGT